jgi:hypothetical protein
MSHEDLQILRRIDAQMAATEHARPQAPRSFQFHCAYCAGESGLGFGDQASARKFAEVSGWQFDTEGRAWCGADHLVKWNWRQRSQGLPQATAVAATVPEPSTWANTPAKRQQTVITRCRQCDVACEVTQTWASDGTWSPAVGESLRKFGWVSGPGGAWWCGATCKALNRPQAAPLEPCLVVPDQSYQRNRPKTAAELRGAEMYREMPDNKPPPKRGR